MKEKKEHRALKEEGLIRAPVRVPQNQFRIKSWTGTVVSLRMDAGLQTAREHPVPNP